MKGIGHDYISYHNVESSCKVGTCATYVTLPLVESRDMTRIGTYLGRS